MDLPVPPTDDFPITGDGSHPHWSDSPWHPLTPISGPSKYSTRLKALYSPTSLYFLFDCEDTRLSCTADLDHGDNLYTQDCVELFLQPDESQNLYLEYELSPLDKHLVLLIANNGRSFSGWTPNPRGPDRPHKHLVSIRGGDKSPGAAVTAWTAELQIPYRLLHGLTGVPPSKGSRWRANFTRIDYDQSPRTLWTWNRDVQSNFHDMKHFGYLTFA